MKVCSTCEREFNPSSGHRNCPSCRRQQRKTPCIDCGELCGRSAERCVKCAAGRQKGEQNGNWKGGGTYHKKGYKMINVPWHPRGGSNHGYVFEHILVMEDVLGRYLYENENIHHKNGVKDDNRPENLELWTRPQPPGVRVEDIVAWAQEVLELYAPELLNGSNSVFSEDGIWTPGQYRPGPRGKTQVN